MCAPKRMMRAPAMASKFSAKMSDDDDDDEEDESPPARMICHASGR